MRAPRKFRSTTERVRYSSKVPVKATDAYGRFISLNGTRNRGIFPPAFYRDAARDARGLVRDPPAVGPRSVGGTIHHTGLEGRGRVPDPQRGERVRGIFLSSLRAASAGDSVAAAALQAAYLASRAHPNCAKINPRRAGNSLHRK